MGDDGIWTLTGEQLAGIIEEAFSRGISAGERLAYAQNELDRDRESTHRELIGAATKYSSELSRLATKP